MLFVQAISTDVGQSTFNFKTLIWSDFDYTPEGKSLMAAKFKGRAKCADEPCVQMIAIYLCCHMSVKKYMRIAQILLQWVSINFISKQKKSCCVYEMLLGYVWVESLSLLWQNTTPTSHRIKL